MTLTLCDGRVVVVTGAGAGLGRRYALDLAAQGARVVVNDLGTGTDGVGASSARAHEVVAEIRDAGGEAVASVEDVSDWQGARRVIAVALDCFGRLDALVNNAGVVRERMLVNLSEDDWDTVIRVHLKGTFAPTRWAARHWREQAKAGARVDARIVNTTSPAGIFGMIGMINYASAKSGIATFTIMAAAELAQYGVAVNAVSPIALTRLTELHPEGVASAPAEVRAKIDPGWVSPLVCWLASSASQGISGNIFEISGHRVAIAESWHRGPSADAVRDARQVDAVVRPLVAAARPHAGNDGTEGGFPHSLLAHLDQSPDPSHRS